MVYLMKLCPLDDFSFPPFIKKGEFGYLKQFPQVLYGLIEYDNSVYIDDLFPQLVQPFPEKLRKSVTKRKAEFLAGRYCCSKLLRIAGARSTHVGSQKGIPIWPLGWYGSISHTDSYVIVALVNETQSLMPGVDIEKYDSKLLLSVVDMFSSPNELIILRASALDYTWALLLLFSAKESLFKSLWPETVVGVDFHFANLISIDVVQQTFTLALSSSLSSRLYVGKRITGRYVFFNDCVITFVGFLRTEISLI
ncbi:4'-phosphopantetheinyl transferase superfamily protein [Salmonella enterica]|nr:4'-phosphopantetheinyl transferase superfamily protein [Salmonella enterica]EDS5482521.1 4'-phosphopantetheinyl transferase superfamily protein [Salmonella enterica subsp. enterica serovar Panama]